jgi:hypothetical protein
MASHCQQTRTNEHKLSLQLLFHVFRLHGYPVYTSSNLEKHYAQNVLSKDSHKIEDSIVKMKTRKWTTEMKAWAPRLRQRKRKTVVLQVLSVVAAK